MGFYEEIAWLSELRVLCAFVAAQNLAYIALENFRYRKSIHKHISEGEAELFKVMAESGRFHELKRSDDRLLEKAYTFLQDRGTPEKASEQRFSLPRLFDRLGWTVRTTRSLLWFYDKYLDRFVAILAVLVCLYFIIAATAMGMGLGFPGQGLVHNLSQAGRNGLGGRIGALWVILFFTAWPAFCVLLGWQCVHSGKTSLDAANRIASDVRKEGEKEEEGKKADVEAVGKDIDTIIQNESET